MYNTSPYRPVFFIRYPSKEWVLEEFHIDNFEPLEDKSLAQAIEELDKIPVDWPDDALAGLAELRKHNEKNSRHRSVFLIVFLNKRAVERHPCRKNSTAGFHYQRSGQIETLVTLRYDPA